MPDESSRGKLSQPPYVKNIISILLRLEGRLEGLEGRNEITDERNEKIQERLEGLEEKVADLCEENCSGIVNQEIEIL